MSNVTAFGKVAIYNTTFESIGVNPLPEWKAPPESLESKELAKKFPLLFSDFHTSRLYNAGWLRNVPYRREIAAEVPAGANAAGVARGPEKAAGPAQ